MNKKKRTTMTMNCIHEIFWIVQLNLTDSDAKLLNHSSNSKLENLRFRICVTQTFY